MNVEYEEFKATVYYTQYKIVVPLLGIRLDKIDFFKKGKLDLNMIEDKIFELYHHNIKKFE